jgi:hypothetical protein
MDLVIYLVNGFLVRDVLRLRQGVGMSEETCVTEIRNAYKILVRVSQRRNFLGYLYVVKG